MKPNSYGKERPHMLHGYIVFNYIVSCIEKLPGSLIHAIYILLSITKSPHSFINKIMYISIILKFFQELPFFFLTLDHL